jgi:hypothetical protein
MMCSIEPTLTFLLGPPSEGSQNELFDLYQRGRREGDAELVKKWEAYEGEVANSLFARENGEPSPMEQVFSAVLAAPIRITGFELTWASYKGLWVTGITISFSSMLVAKGFAVGFPPDSKSRDAMAAFLGRVLRRNWVYAMSIIP